MPLVRVCAPRRVGGGRRAGMGSVRSWRLAHLARGSSKLFTARHAENGTLYRGVGENTILADRVHKSQKAKFYILYTLLFYKYAVGLDLFSLDIFRCLGKQLLRVTYILIYYGFTYSGTILVVKVPVLCGGQLGDLASLAPKGPHGVSKGPVGGF